MESELSSEKADEVDDEEEYPVVKASSSMHALVRLRDEAGGLRGAAVAAKGPGMRGAATPRTR